LALPPIKERLRDQDVLLNSCIGLTNQAIDNPQFTWKIIDKKRGGIYHTYIEANAAAILRSRGKKTTSRIMRNLERRLQELASFKDNFFMEQGKPQVIRIFEGYYLPNPDCYWKVKRWLETHKQ
jgi:hypothetical protein